MFHRFGFAKCLLFLSLPLLIPTSVWACNGRGGGGQSTSSPVAMANFSSPSYAAQAQPAYSYHMAMQQAYAQEQYRRQAEQAAAEKAVLKEQRRAEIVRQKAEKDAKLQAQIAARKAANELAAQTVSPSKKSYGSYGR
jgi:hypothetical protein